MKKEEVLGIIQKIASGEFDSIEYDQLNNPQLVEEIQLIQQKNDMIKQVFILIIDLMKNLDLDLDSINQISESSATKIINYSENLMSIQDTNEIDTIADKSFQIMASVEFQDIISQKIEMLKGDIDAIKASIDELATFYPDYEFQQEESKQQETSQDTAKSEETLGDQNLVDQLLAEFGVTS